MSNPLSSADIARVTLLRLSELGLPPTPENYIRVYTEVAGGSPDAPIRVCPDFLQFADLVRSVQGLVLAVTARAEALESRLTEDNHAVRQSAQAFGAEQDKERMMRLLEAVVAKTEAICLTVEDARADIEATRLALAHVSEELTETRQTLNEDALTGAQNRRGMDATLLREVARARRNKNLLTVAMVDVDHFKQVNDTHGHEAGDRLLIHLGMIAKSVLRESDTLVRYGGEEFLLILPEADLRGAEYVLNRLREMVAKSPLMFADKRIEVTISAGIAQLLPDENGHNLVMRADLALYEAKRAGRNCVRVALD